MKTTPEKITFAEHVLFEIKRIRRELDNLEDYVVSQITEDPRPESPGLVDPRTGKLFKKGTRRPK
jgi:hypothetical protein